MVNIRFTAGKGFVGYFVMYAYPFFRLQGSPDKNLPISSWNACAQSIDNILILLAISVSSTSATSLLLGVHLHTSIAENDYSSSNIRFLELCPYMQ